jgi:hypothetical protein
MERRWVGDARMDGRARGDGSAVGTRSDARGSNSPRWAHAGGPDLAVLRKAPAQQVLPHVDEEAEAVGVEPRAESLVLHHILPAVHAKRETPPACAAHKARELVLVQRRLVALGGDA